MLIGYCRFLAALFLIGLLLPQTSLSGPGFAAEVEPNGTAATATPLGGSTVAVQANIFPAGDVDFYSFTATTGDRVYAATQTLFDASASGDSVLDVLDVDGTTVLETDNNDGTFNSNSSSIAGLAIPANGTYFLRVRHNTITGTIRPYHLHFRLQSGTPVPEIEPNNTTATANPLPASGWVSGTITDVSPGETDVYSLTLNAGDSVFLSLDMNPERDGNVWNGRVGFGMFGNPSANQFLYANDANAGASAGDPNSEAFFFTVKDAGTYYVSVDSISAAGLGANATYHLSVSVLPHVNATANCTTYTSTDVPVAIPTGPGIVTSTLTVPGNPRIADLDVSINLNHTFMQDLDVHLQSPAGNDNGLFTDIGASTVGGPQTLMDIRLDDEAALPFAFPLSASMVHQPELAYRLNWFDGEDAGGVWTLVIRDDATGDGGTLNSWSLTICEPPPPPSCPAGFIQETVYSSNFEADDGGFTHSGAQDEWERGLPSLVPIITCNSGTNCWKTDLDNTYNTSSSQDLLSPNINLTGYSPPVIVSWAQRYHIESTSFDHAFVDAQEAGGANPIRLFEWLGATMNNTVGNPTVTIAESAGWANFNGRADALAGLNAELRFHLDSDTTVQLAGLAIDDVAVTACRAASADLSITKTDGVTTATPGSSVIYTIVASNAGPSAVTGASVTDTFPAACTSVTYTGVAAGGATGHTAASSGNLNDTALNLPVGASITYTATCTINPTATGTLTNTATIASATTDPTPGNNSATDTDTLAALADLSITKTDTPDPVTAGNDLTYTITVNNAGPSNAGAVSLSDPLPAGTTFVSLSSPGGWSCTTPAVGAGGTVSCSIASLGVGSSADFTLTVQVGASVVAGLSNTATVSSTTPDGSAGNNTATATTAVVSLPTTAQGNAGGGLVTAAITGGTCFGFLPGSTSFTAAPTPLPPGITFPYGVFGFTAVCPPGGTLTLTVTYPNLLPTGTQYWKYGPTPEPGGGAPHWYVLPAFITGNTAMFTITNGDRGDDDLDPNNGVIVDQGGPGVPGAGNGTAAIPTLSEWALLILSTLLGGLIWRARRRTGYGSP
jgi:uncharacterized repeat protein (TIGR01451 family)